MPGMSPGKKLIKGRPLTGHTNVGPTVSITVVPAGNPEAGVAKPGFEATATDPEQGNIAAQIVWTALGEGNPVVGSGSPATLTFPTDGAFTLEARVTDGYGASATDTVAITVDPTP